MEQVFRSMIEKLNDHEVELMKVYLTEVGEIEFFNDFRDLFLETIKPVNYEIDVNLFTEQQRRQYSMLQEKNLNWTLHYGWSDYVLENFKRFSRTFSNLSENSDAFDKPLAKIIERISLNFNRLNSQIISDVQINQMFLYEFRGLISQLNYSRENREAILHIMLKNGVNPVLFFGRPVKNLV
jgi:hypothetical protein